MAQKIILEGGGNILAGELREIDLMALGFAKKKNVFILDISINDSKKITKYRIFLQNYFKELGAMSVSFLSLIHSKKEIERHFHEADLLYLPGGRPEVFLKNIQRRGIFILIKNFEGVILGNSAGALILSKNTIITRDEDNDITKCIPGIGLVDFSLEVHYTGEQDEELSKISGKLNIYTIPEKCAVIYSINGVEFVGNVGVFRASL